MSQVLASDVGQNEERDQQYLFYGNAPLPDKLEDLEEAREYIIAIDMVGLKEKLMKIENWSQERADHAECDYKRWLFLRRKYLDELMPPPEDIDKVWHAHLLDTMVYHRDSAAIFGYYFHHFPHFGTRGKADHAELLIAFENTKKRWMEEYQEELKGHAICCESKDPH